MVIVGSMNRLFIVLMCVLICAVKLILDWLLEYEMCTDLADHKDIYKVAVYCRKLSNEIVQLF